jgi:hypothetical protein
VSVAAAPASEPASDLELESASVTASGWVKAPASASDLELELASEPASEPGSGPASASASGSAKGSARAPASPRMATETRDRSGIVARCHRRRSS